MNTYSCYIPDKHQLFVYVIDWSNNQDRCTGEKDFNFRDNLVDEVKCL